MIPHIIQAKHLGGHRVWLEFDDGASGELDLFDELDGPVFEPLKEVEFFGRFAVRYHTLSWENGADFAPEFLREKLDQTAEGGGTARLNTAHERRPPELRQ